MSLEIYIFLFPFLNISYGRWEIKERSQTSGGQEFDRQITWYLIRSIGPDLFESNQWKWTLQRVISNIISVLKKSRWSINFHIYNSLRISLEDKINGNPIGWLQELCMARRWPPPHYETELEVGLPHERQFTIACVVAKYRETGS